MPARPVIKADIEQLKRNWAAQMPLKQMASEVGCCVDTLKRILNREGIAIFPAANIKLQSVNVSKFGRDLALVVALKSPDQNGNISATNVRSFTLTSRDDDCKYRIKILSEINDRLDQLVAYNHLSMSEAEELLLQISLKTFERKADDGETEEPESQRRQVREGFSKIL